MSHGLTVVGPGAGEIVGDTPQRRVLILSERDPLHATYSRFASGQDGANLHVHREHADLFYVLEGELTVRLGPRDEALTLPAGSLACVPPGVIHGFRNASGAAEAHLNFHVPGSRFITYLRGLRDGVKVPYDQHDPPADGGRPITDVHRSAEDVLIDVDDIRVERRRGATDPILSHRLSSYWALDGALKLTVGAEEVDVPEGGFAQVPAGQEHAADGAAFLQIAT